MESANLIGTIVRVESDRPLGSQHPDYGYPYPLNYGSCGAIGQETARISMSTYWVSRIPWRFEGRCIAVIHRLNDADDKLVVVPDRIEFSDQQIRKATLFQEQYFQSEIIRKSKSKIRSS